MSRFLPLFLLLAGCSASRAAMPTLAPLAFEAAVSQPPPLVENHFTRDRTSSISEAELREVLAAPVYLEAGARIGIVPVADAYAPDGVVPQESVPVALARTLEDSGLVELATEVSTDWPIDRGLPGLRELAARYRADYLLLYRHRFNEVRFPTGWAALYATVVGALFVPANRIETAGVIEASLYDVKTGTLLFTAHERVRGEDLATPPGTNRTAELLQRAMLEKATPKLADQVLARFRRLSASRPKVEDADATAKVSSSALRP